MSTNKIETAQFQLNLKNIIFEKDKYFCFILKTLDLNSYNQCTNFMNFLSLRSKAPCQLII